MCVCVGDCRLCRLCSCRANEFRFGDVWSTLGNSFPFSLEGGILAPALFEAEAVTKEITWANNGQQFGQILKEHSKIWECYANAETK